MAIREKYSLTRQVAESIPFFRTEVPELKAEFCHFRDMEPEEFEYVKACASRWLSRLDGEPHKPVAVGDERLMMQLVKSFYKQLLDTCTLVIPEYSEDAYNS